MILSTLQNLQRLARLNLISTVDKQKNGTKTFEKTYTAEY